MASKAVIDAVEEHAVANWDYSPIVGMIYLGPRPDPSGDFLAIQYPVANTTRLSIGNRIYREEGGIRFVLSFTRDSDRALMMQRADELASLYRDRNVGGVRCLQPTTPFIDDSNDEGNFYSLSVVVPYVFEYHA
ncbi:hypothetical protein FHR70_003731 [Microvirga lupini]|uniref:DUF3168 domain-containing protein n=1 Tax=Microvirga lupini TaxID=420324 RepID=A0A7W4YXL6_9HYPH|nr:hypothetical protein [Microvirga lupini]MBB3020645.1 hypothetical protein [Microvirga lupini]